jgi:hypothetical protein
MSYMHIHITDISGNNGHIYNYTNIFNGVIIKITNMSTFHNYYPSDSSFKCVIKCIENCNDMRTHV